jgi:hypothetical protein
MSNKFTNYDVRVVLSKCQVSHSNKLGTYSDKALLKFYEEDKTNVCSIRVHFNSSLCNSIESVGDMQKLVSFVSIGSCAEEVNARDTVTRGNPLNLPIEYVIYTS